MSQASPLTPLQAYAPDFAHRFGLIMAALAALVAARFPRHPRLAALAIPLWGRITRAARRFERLMARIAAGKPARPARPHRSGGGGPHRPDGIPRGRFWLLRALGYELAGLASQLEALLAEAAAKAALAEVPGVGRIVRPFVRMLAIGASQPRPARPAPEPKPKAKEPPEFIPPGKFLFRSHGYSWYELPTPPLQPG